jgi:hypothetical protein
MKLKPIRIGDYRDISVWKYTATDGSDSYLVDNRDGLATIWSTLKSAFKCIDRIVESK